MFNILKKLFASTDNTKLSEILKSDAFLVDVRSESEFKNGSAKGAVNIPLDKIQNHLATLKNKKHIIVFCRSGNRSKLAQLVLKKNGIINVTNGGTLQNIQQLTN